MTVDSQAPRRASGWGESLAFVLGLALLVFVWLANSSGISSSNDGSHVALARALALRGETSIEPERALTLEVDLAEHEGRAYSDRPPGTAFSALPAVWLGDRLDPAAFERARAQARAGREVDPLPAATPYIATYAKRARPGSPRLVDLIATSLAVCAHAALVGLLGLLLIDRLLRALELGLGPRLVALGCLGLATAWGPYSSALFAHVGAATGVAGFLLGVVVLARDREQPRGWVAALTGLAGAWAIACDYLLVLAIVPATVLAIDRRRFALVLLGTTPIVLATLAYHHAAFGSPLAIGYDHQRNFAFARARGSTFSGNLLPGLWTLWGLGRGAGLLAQAPIALAGLIALVVERISGRANDERLDALTRALIGFVAWILILALHRTPWGGGTEDHRYLIPLLPFAAIGLALAWARGEALVRGAILVLALLSSVLVWRHFLAWHDAAPLARPGFGAAAATLVLLAGLGVLALGRKLRP